MDNQLKEAPPKQRGFSLVEMMVGLAVGLVAVAVVTQTAGVFEGQKSTTTSGVEAQENGLMALQLIQEDVKKSAMGFTNSTAFVCENLISTPSSTDPDQHPGRGFYSYYHQPQAGVPPNPGAPADPGGPIATFSTTPVVIQDHSSLVNERSDRITITVGRQFTGSAATLLKKPMTSVSSPLYVYSTYGFEIDTDATPDVYPLAIIAHQGDGEGHEGGTFAQCTLVKITGTGNDDGPFLRHDNHLTPGSGVDADSPEYNPTDAYKTAHYWPLYPKGSRIFRVGTTASGNPGLITRTYRVENNTLTIDEGGSGVTAATVQAVEGIVQIKAQYGIAPNRDGAINDWVEATGEWAATPATPLDAAHKLRVKAVRIAVVARSSKRDPAIVSNPCTNVSGAVNYGPCAWQDTAADPAPIIDLRTAAGDTEWQHYRYRTYQTVIPVRNVIWTH